HAGQPKIESVKIRLEFQTVKRPWSCGNTTGREGSEPDTPCEPIHIPDRASCVQVLSARSSGLPTEQMATQSIQRRNFVRPSAVSLAAARSQSCGLAHVQ